MRYTIEQIEEVIERLTDMDVGEFVNGRRERRYTVPRKAMFFLMIKVGYKRKYIAEHYGVSEQAVCLKKAEAYYPDSEVRRLMFNAEILLENDYNK